MNSFNELLKDSRDDFDEAIDYFDEQERADFFEQDEPHDLIFERADSMVPIYTADLMQLAADNVYLAVEEPELGPAFDGSPTPVNIVAANVFTAIEEAMFEQYRTRRDDWQQEQDEAEEGAA